MEICADLPPLIWDRFVAGHPQGHILQTSPWGALKAAFGWQVQRIALVEGDRGSAADEWCWDIEQPAGEGCSRVVAGVQVLYRPLVGGLLRLAYVPRGPLVDWEDVAAVRRLLAALAEAARARRAISLTLEPYLSDTPQVRERLMELGLTPSPLESVQPRRTLIVDLTGDEEMMAAMKPKTRYNIRLAARKGVVVREGREADLAAFHRLMAVTAERDRFGVHAPAYYERAFRLFVPLGWARLFLAEVEGEPVAALMAFALPPRAWYFYGASGDAHREKMPNYLLQWEAMRWARSLGCTGYDLWGVPDEEEERLEAEFASRSDGLWGVYRFKRGFGGRLVRSVGAWDLPLWPLSYRLHSLAMRLRTYPVWPFSHRLHSLAMRLRTYPETGVGQPSQVVRAG